LALYRWMDGWIGRTKYSKGIPKWAASKTGCLWNLGHDKGNWYVKVTYYRDSCRYLTDLISQLDLGIVDLVFISFNLS